MSRGRHIASKARTGRSKWMVLGLVLGLFLAMAVPVGAASWSEKATGGTVATNPPYVGLTVDLAAFEEADGGFRGQGSYYYNGNAYHIAAIGVCVDPAAGTVTAWGPANIQSGSFFKGTIGVGDEAYGFLSLKDNGDGTVSARAGVRATEAALQTFVTQQCFGSPDFPATGPGDLNVKAK